MNINIKPAVSGGITRISHQPDVIITSASETGEEYPDPLLCASTTTGEDESDPSLSEEPPERPSRVRFRSRVRITSGLNRHRRKSYSDRDYFTISGASSVSGSRSSSISAPLRNEADGSEGKPGWGTLGQRVSILAQSHAQRKIQQEQRDRDFIAKRAQLGMSIPRNAYDANERTPLTNSTTSYMYMPTSDTSSSPSQAATENDDPGLLARDIDTVFGPWPTRLWNHHWWWWQIEPILSCRCLAELDGEG